MNNENPPALSPAVPLAVPSLKPWLLRYRLVKAILKLVQISIASLKVNGRQHIPAHGPYIVVLNHTSAADTPILLLTFPIVEWRFFAVEKWRKFPVFGPIMTWLGAIYVQREQADRHVLRTALDAIRDGHVFGLAPEGTRSKTGQMQAAKEGAAYLASRTHVPILPVGIVNADVLFANAARLRRTRLEINIGEPFTLPDLGRRATSEELTAFTHDIMMQIAALLPERYHGIYQMNREP